MRLRSALPLVVLLTAASCQCGFLQLTSSSQLSAVPRSRTAQRVPVVLELFTSEGCSSCPPADALLARLADEQPVAGADIIALEEHVDYWDHQGWNDPFSSAQWTQRQQDYASSLSDHGVYTPELVVNGRSGFVGSRTAETYRAIKNAITQPHTEITVSVLNSEKRNHERLAVEVGKLQGAQQGDIAEVWFALTEIGLHSTVTGGENAGNELHHAPVVRWLHKAGATDANAAPSIKFESEVKLDSAWKRPNLRLIAFVQEKRSRHILGAAVTSFEP